MSTEHNNRSSIENYSKIADRSISGENRAWSDTPIDRSILAVEADPVDKESMMRMYKYMDAKNWLELLQPAKRVKLEDYVFNALFDNLVKKFKGPTVSYSMILDIMSEFFDIKLEYLWDMLQEAYKRKVKNELVQYSNNKNLVDRTMSVYLDKGFIKPKM